MRRLTTARLILAIISTTMEETAIFAAWRWLLPHFDIHLPVQALIAIMVIWAGFSIWLFVFTTITLRKQVPVGLPSMIGSRGKVADRLDPEGLINIKGELWTARSGGERLNRGEEVVVVGEDGLRLLVRRPGE
jgi:membrane-bound ClpP family serine protease